MPHVLGVLLDRALGDADRRHHHPQPLHAHQREAPQRPVVDDRSAGARPGHAAEREGPVHGDEGPVHRDRPARGPPEAEGVPVVDDRDGRSGEEEQEVLGRPATRRRHDAADGDPGRPLDAAGEPPLARHDVPVGRGLDLTDRSEGVADERVGVLAPHLLLQLLRREGHVPLVEGEDPVDPPECPRAPRELASDIQPGHRVGLGTAPPAVAAQLHQTTGAQRLDDLVGHPPVAVGLLAPAPRQLAHLACPGDQLGSGCLRLRRDHHVRSLSLGDVLAVHPLHVKLRAGSGSVARPRRISPALDCMPSSSMVRWPRSVCMSRTKCWVTSLDL